MAFDFKKEYKEFYMPKGKPEIVTVPKANYIAVRGKGDPNDEGGAYQQAVGILYAVAYTLKMSYKTDYRIEGFFEYVVPPLEGFWWQDGVDGIRSAMDAADTDDTAATKTNAQTTSQQLFSKIYGACSKIRGPIGREEYKTYIIPLLFFKRISDVYDEETENVKKQYGEAAAFFFKEEDIHTFVIPDGCHWQDVRNVSENVGIAIINAMTGIESANGKKLQGVFSSFDDADWANKNKLSDEVLKDLIEHLSAIHVGNGDYSADVMGDAYEYLIKQFAEIAKKTGGEFYTPRAVVKLLVKILDPKAGDTVYEIKTQNLIQSTAA